MKQRDIILQQKQTKLWTTYIWRKIDFSGMCFYTITYKRLYCLHLFVTNIIFLMSVSFKTF